MMGGHHGVGQWGTSSSPVSPTLYVISVGHEGDQFESWKFYYICRKGHLIQSWPQI